MSIISDRDAIRYILIGLNVPGQDRHARFACYLGAGASAEAGVKTTEQICKEIWDELLKASQFSNEDDQIQGLKKRLNWNDPSLRYVSCIREGYPDRSMRVEYFRSILRGITPSFCHHALALLIKYRYFKSTCLTTNFDKLIESAFIQQIDSECQPIRTDEEVQFWANVEDRHYVVKLHGDYDTHNILNTSDETVSISDRLQSAAASLLEFAGLVVIGTAGYEKSIHTLFDHLSKKAVMEDKILRYGLLWGVYMGPSRPKGLTAGDIEHLVQERLEQSEISRDIRKMIERTRQKERLFCFFPVWGAGNFMYELIKATGNKKLKGLAELYLDREMRLRHEFTEAGLLEEAINNHLSRLELKRTYPKESDDDRKPPTRVYSAHSKTSPVEIQLLYGDITSRTFMGAQEFQSRRRAIISPDDTFITAGGGVAEGLLNKAGRQFILNELAKFSPIPQCSLAVTSAGNLPVHYIFHVAAIEVKHDATYSVSKRSVHDSMIAALEKASALAVGALWVPLMGTGAAALPAKESLEGILEAICQWENTNAMPITILIFIYDYATLERHIVYQSMQDMLLSRFTLKE